VEIELAIVWPTAWCVLPLAIVSGAVGLFLVWRRRQFREVSSDPWSWLGPDLGGKLQKILRASGFGSGILDAHGNVLSVSAEIAQWAGMSGSELVGRWIGDWMVPDEREGIFDRLHQYLTVEGPHWVLRRFRTPKGEPLWLEAVLMRIPSPLPHHGPWVIFCLARVVSPEWMKIQELQARESSFRQWVEQMPVGWARWSLQRDERTGTLNVVCQEVNPAMEKIFGIPPQAMLERSIATLWPHDGATLQKELAALAAQQSPAPQSRVCEIGERIYELTVYPWADQQLITTWTDITERHRVDQARRQFMDAAAQLQKFDSLGRLAAGLAHQFNNLLVTILGNADVVASECSMDEGLRERFAEIGRAAYKASDVCRQLLAYAGRGRMAQEELNLNQLLEEMAHLLATVFGPNIQFSAELADGLPKIRGDSMQITQAILNLLTNAAEAIGERPGSVWLKTGVETSNGMGAPEVISGRPLPPGQYVYVEVTDTGCGMSPDTMAQMFDPFFTTKFTGRGLGLAAVLGIVRSHGGGIRVHSRLGAGTTVRLLFPALAGPVSDGRGMKTSDREGQNTPSQERRAEGSGAPE